MTGPTSSLSLSGPVIRVLAVVAVASAAYIVYSSRRGAATEQGLRRSHAIRRRNPRSDRLRTASMEAFIFGQLVQLVQNDFISRDRLRGIAHQIHPHASPETVEHEIQEIIDDYFESYLILNFPSRQVSPSAVIEITTQLFQGHIGESRSFSEAVERHNNRFGAQTADANARLEHTENMPLPEGPPVADSLGADGEALRRTLYHLGEERARQEGVIHRGITCNSCGALPIRGIRWRCANCADFDLCSDCEASNSHYRTHRTHVFYKVRVPAPYFSAPIQEAVYPGDLDVPGTVPDLPALKRRLVQETKMETEEIDALWDQFTCLASESWDEDPNHIGWAINVRAFNHVFIPRYSSFAAAPNLVYNRIFACFDTNSDGFIGFEEFVKGLARLHSRDPKVKLRLVFNGYDVDEDGYITRKDVLRMFRAYYAIEKEAIRDSIAKQVEDLSGRGALSPIPLVQPLGSAFSLESIPRRTDLIRGLPANGNQKPSAQELNTLPVLSDGADDCNPPSASLEAEQIVQDRWARRRFYAYEEEGCTQPCIGEDVPPDTQGERQAENADQPAIPEQERPRESRSSSSLLVEDDGDFETRSNASNPSRPLGERWGDYEIPKPEKDLGKEILYQVTQEALNEMLDPLFKEKEDVAQAVYATFTERQRLGRQLDKPLAHFDQEMDLNAAVFDVGFMRYAKLVLGRLELLSYPMNQLLNDLKNSRICISDAEARLEGLFSIAETEVNADIRNTPSDHPRADTLALWDMMLCRMQLREDWTAAVRQLAVSRWIPEPTASNIPKKRRRESSGDQTRQDEEQTPYKDPTMPQFRPNRSADAVQTSRASAQAASPLSKNTQVPNAFFVLPTSKLPGVVLAGASRLSHLMLCPPYPRSLQRLDPERCENLRPISNWAPNTPVTVFVAIDEADMALRYASLPITSHYGIKLPVMDENMEEYALIAKIRQNAMSADSTLHMFLLASLNCAEKEHRERGLRVASVNYEEFEAKVNLGNPDLQFLWAWLDLVNF